MMVTVRMKSQLRKVIRGLMTIMGRTMESTMRNKRLRKT
jgi:hypothetical protein